MSILMRVGVGTSNTLLPSLYKIDEDITRRGPSVLCHPNIEVLQEW
jgi:hypothetical protein